MTSTSALSVGLIVILKSLLHDGPEGTEYYIANLTLVSTAIALQIVIGLLNILMYQAKRHMADINKDMTAKGIDAGITQYHGSAEKHHVEEQLSHSSWLPVCCRKICCHGDTDDVSAGEQLMDTIDGMHDTLLAKLARDLEAVQDAEVKAITVDQKNEEQVEAANENLRVKKALMELSISQLHRTYFADQLVAKQDYLKKVDTIQTIISYLLYGTFVLNTFLVGFGTAKK